jgi:hypothetical protein
MHRKLCAVLLGLAILSGLASIASVAPAAAQTLPPLSSDRPDFTEGTSTVPLGHVQLEAGITWQEIGEEDSLSAGELLIRYSFTDNLEARLGLGSWTRIEVPGDQLDGYEDPVVQMKIRLTPPADDRPPGFPAVALLVGTSVPVGSEELTADEWEPEALLAFDWILSDMISLGANLGVAFPSADGDRFDQVLASVSAGIAATDRLGVFVETYGFSEEEPDGEATQYVDTGVTFALTDGLQLDARIGFGLNDPSPERFVGVGVAARW